MMEKFVAVHFSASLFPNRLSATNSNVDDGSTDDDDDNEDDGYDKRRKQRRVESDRSRLDGYTSGGGGGGSSDDDYTASSVFSDNLRFDDYLAKYRITFTDDVRSSSGSETDDGGGGGGGRTVALSSSDEMESESVVEQKMANTAQKLHEIFVEGCCALYNDLQNAIEEAEGGGGKRRVATTLDNHDDDDEAAAAAAAAAKDTLTGKSVKSGAETAVLAEMVSAELLDELSGRHRVLERQARQLADDWPKLADAAGARIRTLTRAIHRLKCAAAATAVEQQQQQQHQQRRRNVTNSTSNNNNELGNGAARDTAAVSATATQTTIPSAAAHFRRWLHTSERHLDALKETVTASIAAFYTNYSGQHHHQQQQQQQQREFCCSDESDNKLLSSLQRLRTEHQALQLQIENDGRALLNAAHQQLCAENNSNKNCGVENALAKRAVDRWRRNVEALRNRWHAHWLASLELRQRLDERIDHLTNRSGRTSATLSRYASVEDVDEDTDSSAGREPLCKRLRRSCGHSSLHNHSQQLLLLALESPLPPDDQQLPRTADDVAAAASTAAVIAAAKLKKSDAQSVASYSSGIETASSSMPSSAREEVPTGGGGAAVASTVCRCHHQQRGQMAPCNSGNNSRAPSSSAPPCEEPVGPSSAASTSAPDIGYSSGENNSVASEELPSATLSKKPQPSENPAMEKRLSDADGKEADSVDGVLPEECGEPNEFATASALLTRSYYKMVPLDDAGVTDTELTGGTPRFLFNSSATPPITGGGNPHLTDSVIVHIDNCCCGGSGLPRQQQQQQQLNLSASTERGGDDADGNASLVGDDFEEVMSIMDEQFNAHLQRLRQHGTQWRELRSAKPANAAVATTAATFAGCAASSATAVRRVSSLLGGRVCGTTMDKASCDASSEDEDSAAAAIVASNGDAMSPLPQPPHSANSSGSLQRRRKRFHRRSAQNAAVNNGAALQPPRLLAGDVFVASHSTALTLRLANVLMDQSVYITGHSSDEEASNNINGDDFSSTPSQQPMMSRSWLGADAASGVSSSHRSPLAIMSRSAVLDGEKLPPVASRRRRRALRRRTTTGFTSASRALQNSFLRLAQEQRAEEEMSNANLPLPLPLPSDNNNGGGESPLLLNSNQYHCFRHYYDNARVVDSSEAKVMFCHQHHHRSRRHHSASHRAVAHRRRASSIASTHSSSSSSSSNASAQPEESGDAHYEWDDYRDPCDLLMPPSCLHLDRELNNNNNSSSIDEHQLKRFVDNGLPSNNCAETATPSSVIDCCFVDCASKPSSAVSQQLVPPTLIDDDDFGVELPEVLFVGGSTNASGNSSLSDDADEPSCNDAGGFSAPFTVARRVERMLRESRGALNSVENLLRRGGKRDNNNKQQTEENSKFIHATARENLKKLADTAMQLDSSASNGVNKEQQLTELEALRQRWNRLMARLERHNRRRQQRPHFKSANNAAENHNNSCSSGGANSSSESERDERGNANGGATTVSISLHAILDDMKAQLHLLMLSDRALHPPLRLAEVEEVVAMRKEILHTLLAYRDDLRELAADAAASVSLSVQSAKPAAAEETDDALELWALVDLVETSLHSIERSTLALERLRTDFGALCAAFRHLEAKIDRLRVGSADDAVVDASRKSVECELELCQERMNALETACNTLSGQLAVTHAPQPHSSAAEEAKRCGEEVPPDEPSPPARDNDVAGDALDAAMFADELTRFRDELSRLTLRFQSALSGANAHRRQTAKKASGSDEEEKEEGRISFRSTVLSANSVFQTHNQPQSPAKTTHNGNNRKRRFYAAKFTQTADAAVPEVQSVGTQSAISAETFREYAERIAARKAAKRRSAATTPTATSGSAMNGGERKTALPADATISVTVLRRRGGVVTDKHERTTNAAAASSTLRLPQRLRVALSDSRVAQLCLGCAIAAVLGLLLLTIMAATGTDERNPLLANNYRWMFGPQLAYVQGPPPV